jgi:hypothetical protein
MYTSQNLTIRNAPTALESPQKQQSPTFGNMDMDLYFETLPSPQQPPQVQQESITTQPQVILPEDQTPIFPPETPTRNVTLSSEYTIFQTSPISPKSHPDKFLDDDLVTDIEEFKSKEEEYLKKIQTLETSLQQTQQMLISSEEEHRNTVDTLVKEKDTVSKRMEEEILKHINEISTLNERMQVMNHQNGDLLNEKDELTVFYSCVDMYLPF